MNSLNLKFIDCHSHPHDKKFLEEGVDVAKMMQELAEIGGATIAIGTDYTETEKAILFAKKYDIKFKNTNFIITKSDLEDVCRILSNAYNRYADSKNKMNINRAAFRKSKLWQMYDEAVNIINHRGINITDLKEISLFIQRLEIDRNKINPRVQTFYKIIQTFNPDVTLDEVISLAEEYEGVYD